MDEPTRLKALFQGATVGGFSTAILVGALAKSISIALVETRAFEDTFNSIGMAAALIPTLVGLAIGLPVALFLASRPFASAKLYPVSFALSSISGAVLTRGALSFIS